MRFTFILLLVLLAISCSAPPKPPSADEANRRPANSGLAVSLQSCQSELHSTRIAHHDSARTAESARAALVRLAAQQQALAVQALRVEDRSNTVYTILFAHGESSFTLFEDEGRRLVDDAKASALIALRGRTDGSIPSPAESRVARQRSEAVRDYLVRSGVDPARIRTTWQPVGDHTADNGSGDGRRLNRRVEIELYRATPRLASLDLAPD